MLLVIFIKIAITFTLLLGAVAYITWLERKLLGRLQVRHGPMRVGWHGLLQPIADGIKVVGKEFVVPAGADKPVFILAPIVSVVFAAIPFAVIPWGPGKVSAITNINIALIYILAMSSIAGYGAIMAGWSSNSKYSLLGALRATAQTISYELPLILSLIGPLMLSGSLGMAEIVQAQSQQKIWYIFVQPIAFFCYLLAGIAETQRIPFDMLEDEGSLVTGFYTEYSGMSFSMFAMAEYIHIIMIGVLSATIFMGGWERPFASVAALSFLDVVPPIAWFLSKAFFFIFLVIWLRGTLPRVRYDQLMYLGWKVLLPLVLLNIVLTGVYRLFNLTGKLTFLYYGLTLVSALIVLKLCLKHFSGENSSRVAERCASL